MRMQQECVSHEVPDAVAVAASPNLQMHLQLVILLAENTSKIHVRYWYATPSPAPHVPSQYAKPEEKVARYPHQGLKTSRLVFC